ncbi:MAG: mechanosensitive ion channel [Candidatus Krumholzibacteria bacterium]|nr:mechanosensitive ion channel [Candidatus Krumholzibacteria bacterium]
MDHILNLLVSLKSVIWGAALVAAVIIVLGIVSRFLQKNAAKMPGRQFRNQLTMSAVSFGGLLLVILGLPIDPTMRGQLLSLIGIIISAAIALSSSTILGNAMAGIMLKTLRNFHSGDFIQVGDYLGRVTERGLFHTEIQTADRDLVTLPNMFLATTPVTVVRSSGTIVSATVSLGYDIPHTKIEELLLKAATGIELQDAFVQVIDLGDFSVNYRVAGLLEESKKLLSYRSRLRVAILDALHRGGVEIVSPNFQNLRDYDPQKNFIPAPVRAKKDQPVDAAPIDVVFDKAEVAETLSAISMEQSELEGKLKEASQAVKDAKEDGEKEKAEKQVTLLEGKLEELAKTVVETQEKEKDKND